MSIKKELGEKIRILRKKKNLTQEQLSEIIGINPRNLAAIEKGENFIKSETFDKLLNALDVTTEEIFANDYLLNTDEIINRIYNYINQIKNDKTKLRILYKFILCIKNL